jgi:hypothetical protein
MSFEEKAKHLEQIKTQVRDLLEDHPAARNNDTILICKWLEQQSITTVRGIEINADMIHFESLTRARRLIQSSGEFLPTDETIIKRRRLQDVFAAVMSRGVS